MGEALEKLAKKDSIFWGTSSSIGKCASCAGSCKSHKDTEDLDIKRGY